MMFEGGYAGKLIYIDLSKRKINVQELPWNIIEEYIGGAGLASKLLFDLIPSKIDPFSPKNTLIFSTGPLTGTLFPQASRFVVCAKNPLTGGWGEAHAAGFWAPELKFAGYDAIVVTGASKKPVYLFIENEKIELMDAKTIWGMTTYSSMKKLQELHGQPLECISIGQAGENLCRQASILTQNGRVAARSGIGAVMGSKKLKAIAIRGTKSIRISKPENYLNVVKKWHKKILEHPYTEGRIKYGTSELIDLMNAIGRLPTYNLKQGVFEHADKINAEAYHKNYFIRPRADFACLQRCGRFVSVQTEEFKCIGKGPEYECLDSLGARCGNWNLESIIYMHHLCDEYGMDTIEVGGTISWIMECYENRLVSKEELDGLELTWGNYKAMIEMIHKIATRQGIGDILAEGSYRASKIIKRGTEKYLMHVKGQEIASQEPRAQKSMGLTSAVSPRGADHLYAFPVLDEGTAFEKEIKQWYGEKFLPEMGERLNPKYKGYMVYHNENYGVVIESLGVCKYGTMVPPALYYEDIIEAMDVTCGWKVSEKELKKIGERIVNLNRLFNIREGMDRKNDTLPERLTKEPAPLGVPKGQVVELDQMLDEYYFYRKWDKNGIPKPKLMKYLGLEKEYKEAIKNYRELHK